MGSECRDLIGMGLLEAGFAASSSGEAGSRPPPPPHHILLDHFSLQYEFRDTVKRDRDLLLLLRHQFTE